MNKQKLIKCIENHRLVFSFLLVLVGVLIILLPQFVVKLPWINTAEMNGIELILHSSQIVSAIFVIVGTVIAVWQYCLSSSKRIKEFEFARVEKAIELSNYYKDNILDRYSVVKRVFDDCGIMQMLEAKRKTCELKSFDVLELEEIYTVDEIKRFKGLLTDENFINSIVNVSSKYNIDLKGYTKCVKKDTDESKAVVEISANPNEVVNDFFKTYIAQTLNNAEYFAMSFTHKIADESVIYQVNLSDIFRNVFRDVLLHCKQFRPVSIKVIHQCCRIILCLESKRTRTEKGY